MSTLHEQGIGKGRKIAGYVLSILPSLLLVMSGVMKLMGQEEMVKNMTTAGLGDEMAFIGILEILCVVVYWIPKTSNIGFFLLASYVGGIIAVELSGPNPPVAGIVTAVLLYVGTMLRKPSLSGLGI